MDHRIILVVDDNQTHQYALGKHLEGSGFEVMQATTGSEALKMAASRRPDAVLLDINLPDMTGFDVCQKLKSDPQTKSVPVIFHSATHDTQSARTHAMDLGAVSFLSYPIRVEHLVSVLRGAFLQADES
ncbi:MAG TPA: response regulator [Acidobacteriaceae bacterium]|nr:response regulator [Acidobacteriaceae bacterium]